MSAGRAGESIDGRYRLDEVIGYGSYGQVWRGFNTRIDRAVAVKVLLPAAGADRVSATDRARFDREAKLTSKLHKHPNIIEIQDFGEDDGRLYLVMPLLAGEDLGALLSGEGRLDPPRAVKIIEQLGAALGCAHRNNLVHRDVKPANIFVGPSDHVTLLDFGILSAIDRRHVPGLTARDQFLGSPPFMAQERFPGDNGSAPSDPSGKPGDIYSLACVFYLCLTGSLPFTGEDTDDYQTKHRYARRPRPSAVDPDLADFDDLLLQGLASDPAARQSNAPDFAKDTTAALRNWRRRVEGAEPPRVQGRPPVLDTPTIPPSSTPTSVPEPPPPPPACDDEEPPGPVTGAAKTGADVDEPPTPSLSGGAPPADSSGETPHPDGAGLPLVPAHTGTAPPPRGWFGRLTAPALVGGAVAGIGGSAVAVVAALPPLAAGLTIGGAWLTGLIVGAFGGSRVRRPSG